MVYDYGTMAPFDPYELYDFSRPEAYEVSKLIELIKDYGRKARTRANHPLAKAISSGRLSKWQLQRLAIEDYAFLKNSPLWHAAMLLNIPDVDYQQLEATVLVPEVGESLFGISELPGHPELFMRYCTLGLGLTEDEVLDGRILPTSILCTEQRLNLCKYGSIAESAGVIHIYGEALNIERARQGAPSGGGAAVYPWINREALEYQRIHSLVEDEHGQVGVRLMEKYGVAKSVQDKVWLSLITYVAAEEVRADGIYGAYILNCPQELGERVVIEE